MGLAGQFGGAVRTVPPGVPLMKVEFRERFYFPYSFMQNNPKLPA